MYQGKIVILAVLLIAFMIEYVQAKKTLNPYKVLGVKADADEQQIKKAFKKRSIQFHPDTSKDPRAKEKFQMVVNAYQLLKDPERKRIYDLTGQDGPQQQQHHGGFGGFGGGGFGFQNFGINIEDLLRGATGGHGGHGGHRTFSFHMGGGRPGHGMHFQF